jgi:hypothetical protein
MLLIILRAALKRHGVVLGAYPNRLTAVPENWYVLQKRVHVFRGMLYIPSCRTMESTPDAQPLREEVTEMVFVEWCIKYYKAGAFLKSCCRK